MDEKHQDGEIGEFIEFRTPFRNECVGNSAVRDDMTTENRQYGRGAQKVKVGGLLHERGAAPEGTTIVQRRGSVG